MNEHLYGALAVANKAIRNPKKDGTGNYGAYLTLDALLESIRGPLADNGLSVVQNVTDDDERIYVTTVILHSSGEQLEFGPMSSPRGQNIQHAGAAVTYLRRFTVGAALGIAGDIDDDGQSAVAASTVAPSRAVRAEALQGKASEKQVTMVARLMREQTITEVTLSDFCRDTFGWDTPTEGIAHLSKDHASLIIDALTKQKKPATRSRPTAPDPHDPWAGVPVTGPDGEVLQ